ncbi:alpha/beta fold hydrolase [Ilumatobacter sp.]|uniref:alpha/beta fold hydrolase n=1 Tax=Ilumatobacter sp. TaxID=1967498 RepID=UPI003B52215C
MLRPVTDPATRTVRIDVGDGVRLAADVAGDGSGRTVVLFHGGGQTRHSWGGTQRELVGRGYHVVSVDLRGHGDSDWSPDGDYGATVFPDDVAAVARSLDRPVLVGASLGGTSSLMAIHRADDEIASALVLVDVAPNIEPAGVDRIRSFMHEHIETGFASLEEVADAVQAYNPHRPRPTDLSGLEKNVRRRGDRWYWHWDPAFMWGEHSESDETRIAEFERRGADLEDAARSLTIPTLLVRGRQSDLLSEEGARRFLEFAPDAEFADVEGAGHMVAGDRNDVFTDAVVEFLERRS